MVGGLGKMLGMIGTPYPYQQLSTTSSIKQTILSFHILCMFVTGFPDPKNAHVHPIEKNMRV